jgi:flagellar hook assembly protein FlgD
MQSEGFHAVQWNGKNDGGISVASGLYFYHITAGQFTAARKMLMIR